MSFVWPWALLSLLAIPVCVVGYLHLQQKRGRDAASLGTLGVVREGTSLTAGRRRHIPPIVLLFGIALLVLASARPMLTLPVPRMEGTVVLAFDVSASMAAEDIEPTRMDAAKEVARTLVDGRPAGAKIGAVAFGEGGLVVQPPTDDDEELYATINRLVPQTGTSLGRGILTALDLVSTDSGNGSENEAPDQETARALAPAVIVLLTDGENTDQLDPIEVAQMAIERGVRVHTVGLGTSEGTVIEVDGFNLFTSLNEPVLEEIALLTEGIYFKIEDADNVPSVYRKLETEFIVEPQEVEITSTLGGVSALMLLAGSALSLLWFGRMP